MDGSSEETSDFFGRVEQDGQEPEKTVVKLNKHGLFSDEEDIYKDGWERIGFHRQLAGFFYNYLPIILGGVFLTMGAGIIIPLILPYPEAKGFSEVGKSMYALMFMLFDAGLGSAIGLYVPKHRITDPKRALEYLSFFIWFQMFTGLIQITAISIYIFNWMPQNMAHLAWIFLVYSTVQYPGMLNVLKSALKSFQHYGKVILLGFLQNIAETFTQVGFILLGRWLGSQNPEIGELMGMSIGLVVGLYIDDFIMFFLSIRYLNKVLNDIGLNVGMCLRPRFSKEVAKEAFVYGLKTMPSGIYGNILGFFSFLVTFTFLPQYATWLGMINLVKVFVGQINQAGNIKSNTEMAVSEAYNNGKKKLSQFYIMMALKWRFILTMFLGVTIAILIPIALRELLDIFGENWLPALPLIPFLAIPEFLKIFEKPVSFTSLKRPGIDQTISIISSTTSFLWYMFLIYGIKIELNIYIFILKDIPIIIAFRIVNWTVLHFKLMKINWKELFVHAVLLQLPGVLMYGLFCWAFGEYIFPLGADLMGGLVFALLIIVIVLFLWPAFVYTPLITICGGLNKYDEDAFRKCIDISGPSKGIVKLIYNMSMPIYHRLPWRDKIPVKVAKDAFREAFELQSLKQETDKENIKQRGFFK
ncbi:MAG: hypothetical protein ACFFCS_21390 [Candidatus Hodarchaeota archaeon]